MTSTARRPVVAGRGTRPNTRLYWPTQLPLTCHPEEPSPRPAATVTRFPRSFAIWIFPEAEGGWFVLAPHGHAWIHGDFQDACDDAEWLAENYGGLPIRIAS